MSKKSNNCVLSSGEDDDFSSSDESWEDDETVEVNGFQVLASQVSTSHCSTLCSLTEFDYLLFLIRR